MKEAYLIGYILTYISFFIKQNNKVIVDVPRFKNQSDIIIHASSLAPMLLITSNGIEHVLKILSIISGMISLKKIIMGQNSKLKSYLHAIFISSLLVAIYNNNYLKLYLPFVYLYYIAQSLLLLNNNVIDLNDFVTECLLVHLLFFFTKT